MKRLAFVALALVQGCAVSTTYRKPPELVPVQGKVIYCEQEAVRKDCRYMTKQQERELRRSVEDLSRRMGGF